MEIPSFDPLPIPISILVLTGISVLTLVYVTYASPINKIPQVIGEQVQNASESVDQFGKNVSNSTSDLYEKIKAPMNDAVNYAKESLPISATTANNSSDLGVQPNQPIKIEEKPITTGGSKKRRQKRSKKTRRAKKSRRNN